MNPDSLVATRDLVHCRRYLRPGDAFECSAIDAGYYLSRNMAVYRTAELTAGLRQVEPVAAIAEPVNASVDMPAPTAAVAAPGFEVPAAADEPAAQVGGGDEPELPGGLRASLVIEDDADSASQPPVATSGPVRRTYTRRSTR